MDRFFNNLSRYVLLLNSSIKALNTIPNKDINTYIVWFDNINLLSENEHIAIATNNKSLKNLSIELVIPPLN